MKIIFVSNYYTHHQSELIRQFTLHNAVDFQFIETESMPEERVNMGWEQFEIPKCVIDSKFYSSNYILCQKWITQADIVILGSAPLKLIQERIRQGKLTFLYSERIYKKKCKPYKLPIHFLRFRKQRLSRKNVYMLCASAFTAADYAKTLMFLNRCIKWGYFPAVRKYDDIDLLIKEKKPVSILWAARLIDWKHPEVLIKLAKRLKSDGYKFDINIIGNGIMEQELESGIAAAGLCDCVHMLGGMSPEQVREHMEKSEIFISTSDRKEGWGAVLNEAMNSACAVVASHAIGSVPFLIENGKNGLVYKDGDINDLYRKTKWLMDNKAERIQIAKNAYSTITQEWNAEIASERFINLAENLLNGDNLDFYENGPCSRAEIISDSWFKDEKIQF